MTTLKELAQSALVATAIGTSGGLILSNLIGYDVNMARCEAGSSPEDLMRFNFEYGGKHGFLGRLDPFLRGTGQMASYYACEDLQLMGPPKE